MLLKPHIQRFTLQIKTIFEILLKKLAASIMPGNYSTETPQIGYLQTRCNSSLLLLSYIDLYIA